MSDGAHMGITANRALKTILGGEDQPTEEERATPQETRARLEAAPLFEGERPWDRAVRIDTQEAKDESYSLATDSLAHAFMVLIEEDPSLLEPQPYPDTYPDGSPMPDWAKGKYRDQSDILWDAMKDRWPESDNWLGGATGFMVGFALNSALYASEREVGFGNPAIMTVRKS